MIIGSVPYINALPLVSLLPFTVIKQTPKDLVDSLRSGKVDLALVPVVGALKNNFILHPDLGVIGAVGRVESVGLFARPYLTSLAEMKSIALTPESLTSNHLVKIILRKFYDLKLKDLEFFHEDNSRRADARLLIGDQALFATKSIDAYFDLGEIWHQFTGTGFIYAMFASTRPIDLATKQILINVQQKNLKNLAQFIPHKNEVLRQNVWHYLSKIMCYESTPDLRNGLKLFRQYLDEYDYLKPPLPHHKMTCSLVSSSYA